MDKHLGWDLPRSSDFRELSSKLIVNGEEMRPSLDINFEMGFRHLIPVFAQVVGVEEFHEFIERRKMGHVLGSTSGQFSGLGSRSSSWTQAAAAVRAPDNDT